MWIPEQNDDGTFSPVADRILVILSVAVIVLFCAVIVFASLGFF